MEMSIRGSVQVLAVGCQLMVAVGMAEDVLPPAHDFGKGFTEFASYGLPSVATATYVKIERCWPLRLADPLPYDYESSGNAWMISEVRDDRGQPVRGTFVINGGELVELDWATGSYERPVPDDPLVVPPSKPKTPKCRWRKANVERDVKTALHFLKSNEQEKYPEISLGNRERGQLFLMAFYLQQRGDVTNANSLAHELFKHVTPWQKVIVDGMNVVADAQYENLYRTFRIDLNWTAYRDGLKSLLAKYPQGWRRRPGVNMLLSRVEERLAQSSPASGATNGMVEADLKQAGGMLGVRAIRTKSDVYGAQTVLWLVPSAWREKAVIAGDPELEIRARGVAGIPYLLALSGDGALTEADRAAVCMDRGYGPPVLPPENAGGDAIKQMVFDSLNRPATRGEVAVQWLADMVPERFTGGQWNRKKGEDLKDAIGDFYTHHQKDTDEELAALCLPAQYGSLNASAVDFLVRAAARKPVPALEDFLLGRRKEDLKEDELSGYGDAVPRARMDLLVRYAALRGEDARPTVERMASNLKKAAEEFKKPGNMRFQNAEQEKQYIDNGRASLRRAADSLATLQYGKSIKELLASAIDERTSGGEFDNATLMVRLESAPPAEVFSLLLRQAVETNSPHARAAIAGKARTLAGGRVGAGVKPTDNADLWKVLITDDRADSMGDGHLVSDGFLILNEQLFAPGSAALNEDDIYRDDASLGAGRATARLINSYGRLGRELVLARVRGRLAGTAEEKLPRYPAEAPLSPEDGVTLKAKYAGVDGRDQAAEVTGHLSIYERAALPDVLQKDPGLNAKLAAIANHVVKVTIDGADEALRAKFMAWQGKVFDLELLRELEAFCAGRARSACSANCLLARKGDFGGCEVSIWSEPSTAQKHGAGAGATSSAPLIAGYAGLVCAPGVYGAATWRIAADSSNQTWATVVASSPELVRSFQAALGGLCDSRPAASEEAFVRFETRGEPR